MFTGLIQSVGQVQRRGRGLFVEGCGPFLPINEGDSIAVDGVCLTVAELSGNGFIAAVSEETFLRTTLGQKADLGGHVNLEPALRFSDRLGGHLVTGHVDGIGIVKSLEELQNSWKLEVKWVDKTFGRYICDKASIAIDGISLTIAGCTEDGSDFWIAVVPHTWENTSLKNLVVESQVNLEIDLLAKYSERFWTASNQSVRGTNKASKKISRDWLAENGWN